MSANRALLYVKKRRSQVHPNAGFLRQLLLFELCSYKPTPHHPVYVEFQKEQEALRLLIEEDTLFGFETGPPEKVDEGIYIADGLPDDTERASATLKNLGITHVLSIRPSTTLLSDAGIKELEINFRDNKPEDLVLQLPAACDFIDSALNEMPSGRILIHSWTESRLCLVLCAFYMRSRQTDASRAFEMIEIARPLFNPDKNFLSQLELFSSCAYKPTPAHPLVQEFIEKSPMPRYRKLRTLSAFEDTSETKNGIEGKDKDNGKTPFKLRNERAWGASMGSIRARWAE